MASTKRRSVNALSIPPGSDGGPLANFGSGVRAASAAEPLDEIDRAFERLESGVPPPGVSEATAMAGLPAQSEHAALLRQVVIDEAQFLRECMRELASSRYHARWVATTRPVLRNLLVAMDALEPSTLGQRLAALDALLESAHTARASVIDARTRVALLAAHAQVDAELARVFDLSFEPVLEAPR
jgi:hypothetical protein